MPWNITFFTNKEIEATCFVKWVTHIIGLTTTIMNSLKSHLQCVRGLGRVRRTGDGSRNQNKWSCVLASSQLIVYLLQDAWPKSDVKVQISDLDSSLPFRLQVKAYHPQIQFVVTKPFSLIGFSKLLPQSLFKMFLVGFKESASSRHQLVKIKFTTIILIEVRWRNGGGLERELHHFCLANADTDRRTIDKPTTDSLVTC